MKPCVKVLALAIALTSVSVQAEYIQTDRYGLELAEPTKEELDPLSITVKINFPPNVVTVRDAIKYVMEPSGWVLADEMANDSALAITLDRPIPQVHRNLSLMPLRTVLQVLVGGYFEPVEDPIRRIYTFDLKEEFRGLINE
ncbi:hypothetical protein OPW39_15910 [Vibrio europaeus]|uniref:PFGI-1 class ICE element type IV pilus protein PilL2 n=1 Tax=Vibrio europaeus TaxID=300876 RepID=UPI00233F3F3B|nr:hypothetical protein [Vibrio europaeus]MDC5870294.1 hypothetical protein [Vibrio europaeus]